MALRDIVIGVVLIAAVAGLWWLARDSRKKGAKLVGKMCGGCPCSRNSDGTLREGTKARDGEA